MPRSSESALRIDVPTPGAVLELLKPITWFPPMWAFACGAVSSGIGWRGREGLILLGVVLCGPLLCAATQAVNDWFDRHVDALNEPNRPIPSGRMPGHWGLGIAVVWNLLALLCAAALGPWVFRTAALGLLIGWAYSAPPLRLKRNGWWGNLACAVCYEGFAWVSGWALMSPGIAPPARILGIAALYSLGAHGIMTLNDFKSIEGDARCGLGSLPVRLGAARAGVVACVAMALPQFAVVGVLFALGAPWHGAAVAVLLGAQLLLMRRLLTDPRRLAPWYNGTGVVLYVSGMLVSAFALKGLAP